MFQHHVESYSSRRGSKEWDIPSRTAFHSDSWLPHLCPLSEALVCHKSVYFSDKSERAKWAI